MLWLLFCGLIDNYRRRFGRKHQSISEIFEGFILEHCGKRSSSSAIAMGFCYAMPDTYWLVVSLGF